MLTVMLAAALLQNAAINKQRDAYISCLTTAREAAKAQSMAPEGFEAYARQTCASTEEKFKAALIAFDLKNKVSRKQALSDAQLQVDDFVSGEAQIYKRNASVAKPQ